MAKTDEALAERCLSRLRELYEALLSGKSWGYAEVVAERMCQVIAAKPGPALHAEALRLMLYAAVGLHRFAAMDRFNIQLSLVTDPRLAASVAEVLKQESSSYKVVAEQLQSDQLAPAIRNVRASVLQPPPPDR